jgi:hypothetical protein
MAHWAEIDKNNVVVRVTVGDNNDPNGDEGYQWLIDNLGGTWIKTSYNRNIRKNFAGIGFTYDVIRDAFIPQQPFDSWVLNEETCTWQAPTPYPSGDGIYQWIEDDLNWQLVESGA